MAEDDEAAKRRAKLQANVAATANNVVTACKNYASANGISPVSLLDAAASHLATAVVGLVRSVKIRPTAAGELDEDDEDKLETVPNEAYFSVAETMRMRNAARDSVYSALSTPPDVHDSTGVEVGIQDHSRGTTNGIINGDASKSSSVMPEDVLQLEQLKVSLTGGVVF